MKFATFAAISASLLAPLVSAHGGVILYTFDGKEYQGHNPGFASIKRKRSPKLVAPDGKRLIQREWLTYDPIRGGTNPYMACNDPGSAAPLHAKVKAGGTVNACFNQPWAHNSGPLTVYMTECPDGDCANFKDLSSAKWFPIYKEVTTPTGQYATQAYMNYNSNCITHKIPSDLKAGAYLIRHETINLANPEHYANCANVKVTGSGGTKPGAKFRATMMEIYGAGSDTSSSLVGTKLTGPPIFPSGKETGGQVFTPSGINNACNGQSIDFGGPCSGGGSDTKPPTPPHDKLAE